METHSSTHWTEELVREKLPRIKVKSIMDGTIRECRIRGKRYARNRFATVVVRDAKGNKTDRHYAWGSIVNALNTNKPLIG